MLNTNYFNFYNHLILPFSEEDIEKSKVLWLINLRWSFLFIQFFFVIPTIVVNWPIPMKFILYLGLCFSIVAFNFLVQAVVKFSREKMSSYVTFASLVFDLLTFSALCSFLLGLTKIPVENLFFIHVVLGSVLLSRYKSFTFYLFTAFLFGAIQYFHLSHFVAVYSFTGLAFNQFMLFTLWLISFSLSRYVSGQKDIIALMKINAEKVDRLRAIGALTAGFSHELASPLNALRLYVEREKRKQTLAEAITREMLNAIKACNNVIEKINLSQLDGREYLFQSLPVQRLVDDIVNSWMRDHQEAKIKIVVAENVASKKIEVALINLSQALLNVLDNAYESISTEEILFEVFSDKDKIMFRVSDKGLGFSTEVLERFGEPFLTTKKEGTGLGLYSVFLFVQSLGGVMQIRNREGQTGAIVEFGFSMREE